jgi:hypothetical protein
MKIVLLLLVVGICYAVEYHDSLFTEDEVLGDGVDGGCGNVKHEMKSYCTLLDLRDIAPPVYICELFESKSCSELCSQGEKFCGNLDDWNAKLCLAAFKKDCPQTKVTSDGGHCSVLKHEMDQSCWLLSRDSAAPSVCRDFRTKSCQSLCNTLGNRGEKFCNLLDDWTGKICESAFVQGCSDDSTMSEQVASVKEELSENLGSCEDLKTDVMQYCYLLSKVQAYPQICKHYVTQSCPALCKEAGSKGENFCPSLMDEVPDRCEKSFLKNCLQKGSSLSDSNTKVCSLVESAAKRGCGVLPKSAKEKCLADVNGLCEKASGNVREACVKYNNACLVYSPFIVACLAPGALLCSAW